MTPRELYYQKNGEQLVKNLQNRHFEAYYCATKEEALKQALALIPTGATVGWGGCTGAMQLGLVDAVKAMNGDMTIEGDKPY